MTKTITYKGYKIVPGKEYYTIYWSKNCKSAANTLDDAKWMIDEKLKDDDE